MQHLRERLETHQVVIYFCTIAVALGVATQVVGTQKLENAINPALALMLFVTFLQVPLAELGQAFSRVRFLAALLSTNFVMMPLLVAVLIQFLPADPLLQLGVLLVLLTPCIDYVVTFAHLGRADARVLLAATPTLLVMQMVLLPVYLRFFLGDAAMGLVQLGPFVHAFVWLIAVPLVLAAVVQLWAARSPAGLRVSGVLGLLPVPATALVLFIVIVPVVPQLGSAVDVALSVVPVYIAFALIAPLLGWGVGRAFRLDEPASRSVAFSAGTRNSLVVLPLALVVPGAIPILPAIIVTQTLVELVAELVYVRLLAQLDKRKN